MVVGSTGRGPVELEAEPLSNVRIVPWQTLGSNAPYLYASDVLTIPPSTTPLEQVGNTVLPLKVFVYLGAGRALFAADSPDTAESHEQLLGDPALLGRRGKACRDLAEGLTWDSRAAKIEAFFRECLARDSAGFQKGLWSAPACARDSMKSLARSISTGKWIYR